MRASRSSWAASPGRSPCMWSARSTTGAPARSRSKTWTRTGCGVRRSCSPPAPTSTCASWTASGGPRIPAGDEPPATPAEVTTVAWALRRGLPGPVVERVVAALPRPPRASAMHAVADLAAHHFDSDSAADLIIAAIGQGLARERLLDVSAAAAHELQRGHTHAEALALVRRELPNVPASPKPTRSAVARARRPGAATPP